ncbi:MAG: hypothetical protein E7102_06160 [Prevotella ruminicola]|jgi:hypothetical protein|uniref:WD40-like Beta Propeller Repeat n=1 Tax=Xylanibacter ruminicola TaxID=839 RepID=A0A928BU74_XYLRU|nr:hypothetical protein [Xylanibacter ruminicola]
MNLRKITILLLAILLSLPMAAQKRKRNTRPKPAPVVEEPQEDPRITNMREMTQQIIIVDSIVVNKDQFLASIRLSSECGQLMNTGAFFRNQLQGTLYLNEMGNKVYFSQPDGHQQQLYTADKLGNEWSKPQPLQGLSEGIDEASYPFMLTDGLTFYFAGKGEESIGGYDIFMTRYDSRSGSFLKPENIGMPFNSEANDYMYAIDEANRIGYFASDRRQPEGKVCIYIFIPSDTRKTYDNSKYTEEQIRNFADIASIADTWGNGTERKAALDRIKSKYATHDVPGQLVSTGDAASAVEFHSKEANSLYQKLLKEQNALDIVNSSLDMLRQKYHKANASERNSMKSEILKLEEQALQLNASVKQLTKATRNAEINSKNHK